MNVFSHLKRSSGAITAALAAFVCAVPASANAAYTDGDVFLCFRATGGVGASTDILVDLGPVTQFTTATGHLDVNLGGDILADLSDTYGPNWSNRSDVRWSVVGVKKTVGSGFVANTMFASRHEAAPGTQSTAWASPSTFGAGTPAGKIQAMGQRYALGATTDGGTQTVSASNPNALLQATSITTSYAQFQPGGVSTTGNTAFSYFDDALGIEGSFGGGAAKSVVDFYNLTPGGTTALVGGFRVTADGALVFEKDVTQFGVALATEIYTKAGDVPGAGVDPNIQVGAKWTSFGPPAINDAGTIALVGHWSAPAQKTPVVLKSQSGIGIFVGGELLVKTGVQAPGQPVGVLFKGLKDPVIDNRGHVAFLATLTGPGISTANDLVVVTNGRDGNLEILAQEGTVAPGSDGANFFSFTAVSIKGEPADVVTNSQSGIVFLGSLAKGTGTPAVDAKTDGGAWWLPSNGTAVTKIIREGDPSTITPGAPTFKSFNILKGLAGSPSQGRGQVNGAKCLLQVVLSDNTQEFVTATPSGLTPYAVSGGSLNSVLITDGKWSKLNFQAPDSTGARQSTLGTLLVVKGGTVTSAQARGIFTTVDSGAHWEPLCRTQAADAPGLPTGVKFQALKDPVSSPTDAGVAFMGTGKGVGVTTADDTGIWWKPAIGSLTLVAREGAQPPGAPIGAKYKVFSSLALPGGATGPIFTAMLDRGPVGGPAPGGITSIDDLALYGVNSSGVVSELIRENQPLAGVDGKIVKTFSVLKVVSGTAGATRCFNTASHIVSIVSFTDKSVSVVDQVLP